LLIWREIIEWPQSAIAIQVHDFKEANNICKALESDQFGKTLKSCSFSLFRVDWNIFKCFKKDSWKEYI
jgi:hypothetical protein